MECLRSNSWICHKRITSKTFARIVIIDQERKLRDRRRSDTVGPGVIRVSVHSWLALLVCAIFTFWQWRVRR